MLHNGPPAALFGTLGAFLAAGLYACGILPGIQGGDGVICVWPLVFGLGCSLLILLLWRGQKLVFVDRMCINQVNPRLKAEGIVSLAGILKTSESMLVLWDEAFGERLWCLFELAAFLKSAEGGRKPLTIRPTCLGHCTILSFLFFGGPRLAFAASNSQVVGFPETVEGLATFLPLFCVVAMLCLFIPVRAFRRFFHSVEVMHTQLASRNGISQAMCSCCSFDHKAPDGTHMACDKEGSQEWIGFLLAARLFFQWPIQIFDRS